MTHLLMDEFKVKVTDGHQHGILLQLIEIAKKAADTSFGNLRELIRQKVIFEVHKDNRVFTLFSRTDLVMRPVDDKLKGKRFLDIFVDALTDVVLEKTKEFRAELILETEKFSGGVVRLSAILPEIIKFEFHAGQGDHRLLIARMKEFVFSE